ncbi:MAG: extracellular solute-binding protein [Defluviitaleaceae bacterium]|nr:extracellular solute-binding protein [Defluviitaleaceae bacterium]
MKNNSRSKRICRGIICWLLATLMVSSHFSVFTTTVRADENGFTQLETYEEMLAAFGTRYHFTEFLFDHRNTPRPALAEDIVINAADYAIAEGMQTRHIENWEGVEGTSVWTDEQGLIRWDFHVAEAGLYNITVKYYTYSGRSSDIQRAIFINGEQPFFEASPVEFRRIWVNQFDYIQQDSQGNDMRPTQVEEYRWTEAIIRDSMGTYNEPLSFYFHAGLNSISFVSLREPMMIRELRIHQAPEVISYAELAATRGNLPRPSASEVPVIRVEGQDAARKSSPMLAPSADTGGPGVYPYNARYIRINNIGGGSWSEPGSWIEWEIEVPQAGLYSIAMNVRQNFNRGANSFRRITINGEIPFEEMEAVPFGFRNGWRVDTLGGEDDPYLFWLEAGTNVIRMETVLGDYAPYLREIQESLINLNELYRQVIMITGLTPDRWRDYEIARRLPHLRDELIYERIRLDRIHASLIAMAPGRGGRDAMIHSTSQFLTRLYRDIEGIPIRMSDMRINIGSLGTWIMMVREHSLAVDAIYVLPHDAPTPDNGSRWWRQILHEILTLFFSFIIDYNMISTAAGDNVTRNIEVWIGTGRDQANIIKSLVDETFTRDTGIGVTLMLVDMATILPATVARQGPDVTLSVWNTMPMDFGLRGAVADISNMPNFHEVSQRFHPATMTPFEFEGRVFALPETMTFPMLFYRKDILHEIGLTPPDTWDEVRSSIAHLSQFHMDFGLPVTLPVTPPADITHETFAMFLFQNGGTFYNEACCHLAANMRSALDSEVSLNAFRDLTRFYNDYNLDREFNFINRFRMGEMPLAVADYTNYNVLQVFAPEIRGLWGFRPVPGTVQADGSIDRSVAANGAAVIMMEINSDRDASWEFMKWWTSTETQNQFGLRMEALMGAAARHPTANIEAFSRMPWPVADYNNIRAQMHYAQGIPQIPGAYFTPRQIRNAFFTTVELEEVGAREALTDFVRLINDEIRAKRREFGMDY